MSFTVRSLPIFNKEFKALAKKYPSLVSDVEALGAQLRENPTLGVPIGHGCYKNPLGNSEQRKRKA